MSNIQQAIEYPRNDDDWLKTVLIGGVLLFFSWLFIPVIVVYGYLVGVIRGSLEDTSVPPAFEEWEDLLVEGIQAWVIGVVYMLIPLVVAGITVGGAILSLVAGSNTNLALGQMFFGLALSTVLSLVFGYIAVAAVVNFARVGTLGAGFAFDDIKPVLFSRDYAIGWLLSVGVILVAGAISGILNAIPILGALVGAFIAFYALVVAARLWADGFAEARRHTDSRDPSGVDDYTA